MPYPRAKSSLFSLYLRRLLQRRLSARRLVVKGCLSLSGRRPTPDGIREFSVAVDEEKAICDARQPDAARKRYQSSDDTLVTVEAAMPADGEADRSTEGLTVILVQNGRPYSIGKENLPVYECPTLSELRVVGFNASVIEIARKRPQGGVIDFTTDAGVGARYQFGLKHGQPVLLHYRVRGAHGGAVEQYDDFHLGFHSTLIGVVPSLVVRVYQPGAEASAKVNLFAIDPDPASADTGLDEMMLDPEEGWPARVSVTDMTADRPLTGHAALLAPATLNALVADALQSTLRSAPAQAPVVPPRPTRPSTSFGSFWGVVAMAVVVAVCVLLAGRMRSQGESGTTK